MSPKIYCADYVKAFEEAVRILKSVGEVSFVSGVKSEEDLKELFKDAEALVGGEFDITAGVIEATERLKIISEDGVGYDNIDVAAATRKGIVVTNQPGVNKDAVADLTIGLMLSVVRKILVSDSEVRRGEWHPEKKTEEFTGMNIGLVGLGNVGAEVARRLRGFKVNILYYDEIRRQSLEEEEGLRLVTLRELLAESDIISLHVPLTERTKNLIGHHEFSLMKEGAYLINTCRGKVVDEEALLQALKSRKLAGAGLDVLSCEPPSLDNPILKLQNVVLTPHAGSSTIAAATAECVGAAEEIARVLRGERPLHPVNPEVLK